MLQRLLLALTILGQVLGTASGKNTVSDKLEQSISTATEQTSSNTTESDELEQSISTATEKNPPEHETSSRLLPSQNIPSDVLRFIVEWADEGEKIPVHIRGDISHIHVYLRTLAENLAYFTGYPEFKDYAPFAHLPEFVRLAEVLQGRFYLVFVHGRLMYFTISRIYIDYVNNAALKNPSISLDERREYFSNLAENLYRSGEFNMLSYLINVTAEDVVNIDDDGLWFTRKAVGYNLPATNLDSALKVLRQSSEVQVELFVGIFLAPIDNVLSAVQPLLKSLPLGIGFSDKVLEFMEKVASYEDHDAYIPQATELVYRNVMTLLDLLTELTPNDEVHCRAIAHVRLLYSIRLGFRLKDGMIQCVSGETAAEVNRNLFNDIITSSLLELNQPYWAKKRISSLSLTAANAKNRELLLMLLQYMFKEGIEIPEQILFYTGMEKLVSYSEYKALAGQRRFLKIAQFCKAATGEYPDNDWIKTIDDDWKRLEVFAEMQDNRSFETLIKLVEKDLFKLGKLMKNIIYYVKDPVPFVSSILQYSGAILNAEDSWRIAWTLGTSKFLCAIILDKSNDYTIFEQMVRYSIAPRSDFFEALLEDKALADSFRARGKDHPLRKHIRVNTSALSEKCRNRIAELLDILQLPNDLGEGFNLQYESTTEIYDRFQSLRLDTLTSLDLQAKPGWLACWALEANPYHVFFELRNEPKLTFEMWNPLNFCGFEWLMLWYTNNKESFIRYADFRIVLFFYVVQPDMHFWTAVDDLTAYPVPLERAIRARCAISTEPVSLKFLSVRERKRFDKEVFPTISETLKNNGCELHYIVNGETMRRPTSI